MEKSDMVRARVFAALFAGGNAAARPVEATILVGVAPGCGSVTPHMPIVRRRPQAARSGRRAE